MEAGRTCTCSTATCTTKVSGHQVHQDTDATGEGYVYRAVTSSTELLAVLDSQSEYSPNLPKFVPFERIMEKLSISRSQAYALVRSGQIRAIQVGEEDSGA